MSWHQLFGFRTEESAVTIFWTALTPNQYVGTLKEKFPEVKLLCPLKCFPCSFIFTEPLLFSFVSLLSLCTSVEKRDHCIICLTLLYSATGSNIGTVLATDADEKNTLNSRLRFQIQSQEPGYPSNNLFYIQQDTGTLQLTGRSLNKRDSAKYFLKVLVTDSSMYCLLLYIGITLSTLAWLVLSVHGMWGDKEDLLNRQ